MNLYEEEELKPLRDETIDNSAEEVVFQSEDISDDINSIVQELGDIPEILEDSISELDKITDKNLDLPMSNTTPEQKSNWDSLHNAMLGDHAKKFNDILSNLPDREFVRVYLKSLEFFVPKVTRVDGKGGKKRDTTINIQINRGNRK